jgi:hypothetical protein
MKINNSLLAAVLAILVSAMTSEFALAAESKPNIVFIMGDDIGMWNIGAYSRGMMAGRTPNIDKLASEGAIFTDYYAEASCTAGRANFITGELPIRTGLTTVGQAGAKIGIPDQAVTIATVLKDRPRTMTSRSSFGSIRPGCTCSPTSHRNTRSCGLRRTPGLSRKPMQPFTDSILLAKENRIA